MKDFMQGSFRPVLAILFAALLSLQITACGALSGSGMEISQNELLAQLAIEKKPFILDVRTMQEYEKGHIPGAININFLELERRIDEIQVTKNSPIVVYCEHGIRANVAETTLKEAGFESLLHLQGQMSAWRKSNLPIERGS